jgi:hypothetical protein
MNKIKSILLLAIISISLGLGTNAAIKTTDKIVKPVVKTEITTPANAVYEPANSLDIVVHPSKYLNKRVTIRAKFDKFSTLGLDYKPAYRSSEKYITFLIKRDDVIDHVVPLSELKNFLKREIAEKYIDLKAGDEIEYSGIVFSDALGDAWLSVEKFKVLNQPSKEQDSSKK